MSQPKLALAKTTDPANMDGLGYLPEVRTVEITITQAAVDQVIYSLPANVYVDGFMRVKTALNAGTIEIGTASDADALCASGNYDETVLNTVVRFSTPKFFATATDLTADVVTATSGVVQVVLFIWDLNDMFDVQTIHNEKTI